MAIFTLEMGYPLDNSRQTDNSLHLKMARP